MRRFIFRTVTIAAITLECLRATTAFALPIITDAEIEETVTDYATPIFEIAGLPTENLQIVLVSDDRLNAFVAGGQTIFVHTGLLLQAEKPEEVIGVLAHETGHIVGGHLAKLRSQMGQLSLPTILSYLLGAAITVAGGGQAGAAIIAGSQQFGQRTMLAHTRSHERAADQFAVTALNQLELPATGLEQMMQRIAASRNSWQQTPDPYLLSHPLPRERLDFLEEQAKASNYQGVRVSPALQTRHQRLRGKLYGFLHGIPDQNAVETYHLSPLAQQYATAIGSYRTISIEAGNEAIKPLQQQFPNDPYLLELQGQMVLENSQADDYRDQAISLYRQATTAAGNKPLPTQSSIQQGLVRALLTGKPTDSQVSEAETLLQRIVQEDRRNGRAWSLLAKVYANQQKPGEAALASAETAALQGDFQRAERFLLRAKPLLENNPTASLQLEDLERLIEQKQE